MTKTDILNLNIIDVRGIENQIMQKCGSQEVITPAYVSDSDRMIFNSKLSDSIK